MVAVDPTSKVIARYPPHAEVPQLVFMTENLKWITKIIAQAFLGEMSPVESYALGESYKQFDTIPLNVRSSSAEMIIIIVDVLYFFRN